MSFLYFTILVGLLVTLHELGHLLAALMLKVRVERFSIGFGKSVFSTKIGNLNISLGILPLGGYVRLDESSFVRQPIEKKLLVIVAGPLANIVVAFMMYGWIHAQTSSLYAPVVGSIVQEGPADDAGIVVSDRIVSIDGKEVETFDELQKAIQSRPDKKVPVVLLHNGKKVTRFVHLRKERLNNQSGDRAAVGYIGIAREPVLPVIGVLDQNSKAGIAGLRSGDVITSIGNTAVKSWSDVVRLLSRRDRAQEIVYLRQFNRPSRSGLTVMRAKSSIVAPHKSLLEFGLSPAELFIDAIEPESPADKCGLKEGDLIASIDGTRIRNWRDAKQSIWAKRGESFSLKVKRYSNGEIETKDLNCRELWVLRIDPLQNESRQLWFGASTRRLRGEAAKVLIPNRMQYTFTAALNETLTTLGVIGRGIFSLLKGENLSKSVGGPLSVYVAASYSRKSGLVTFLRLLALVSINLALLNLLPVPALDGGQGLLVIVETIRRKPLSELTHKRIHRLGIAIVVIVTVLALRNDVIRFLL